MKKKISSHKTLLIIGLVILGLLLVMFIVRGNKSQEYEFNLSENTSFRNTISDIFYLPLNYMGEFEGKPIFIDMLNSKILVVSASIEVSDLPGVEDCKFSNFEYFNDHYYGICLNEGGNYHEFYYDIWSNVHYGYVGSAAGFTSKELQDGAGGIARVIMMKEMC